MRQASSVCFRRFGQFLPKDETTLSPGAWQLAGECRELEPPSPLPFCFTGPKQPAKGPKNHLMAFGWSARHQGTTTHGHGRCNGDCLKLEISVQTHKLGSSSSAPCAQFCPDQHPRRCRYSARGGFVTYHLVNDVSHVLLIMQSNEPRSPHGAQLRRLRTRAIYPV